MSIIEFTDYKSILQTDIKLNSMSGTFTVPKSCKHANGWYGTIPFWIFYKRIFACLDCGDTLYGKRLIERKKK